MRKLLMAVALCVPVLANADLLFIKYEGSVSGIEEQSGAVTVPYSIGDSVRGQLTIDLNRSQERGGSFPAPGTGADATSGELSFVDGRPHIIEGRANDGVFLFNDIPALPPRNGTFDRVEVHDGVIAPNGANDGFSILVERYSSSGQLMGASGLLPPQFDVTPDEGTTLTGKIQRGFTALLGAAGTFRQTIDVAFSHVSMGVCRPST